MFNPRVYNDQENIDEPLYPTSDFPPSFFPNFPFEPFPSDFFGKEDPTFFIPPENFENFEHNLSFMFDPSIYQSFQEDMKRLIPGFDMFSGFLKEGTIPEAKSEFVMPKTMNPGPLKKIGTISIEERKEKVKKFLEKRKRRIFKKRISYACRKRVADSRVRIKGRFITKKQANELGILTKEE